MITVVYGTHNGTQDSIAWWLCHSPFKTVGPQVYEACYLNNEWNGSPNGWNGLIIDEIRHEEHTECHRLMENIRGDIIAPMRKFEKDYDMLIWSNFFGGLKHTDQKIDCDKLIICDEDRYEDAFHYVITHAFRPIVDKKRIDDQSEIWWMDHKLVNGNVTDNWKQVWYDSYHQQMHDEFQKGNLVYMWQLNYMHWDVNSLIEGEDIKPKLEPADNLKRLLYEKIIDRHWPNRTDRTLWANPGALYIRDPNWFDNDTMILDYLEIDRSEKLTETLDKYKHEYIIRRDWFDSLVKKTFA